MIKIIFDKENNKSIAFDGDIKVGECDFIEENDVWNVIHTEVNDSYQGQGIARKLVNSVIENSRKYDKIVIADCWYAKKLIENNKNK